MRLSIGIDELQSFVDWENSGPVLPNQESHDVGEVSQDLVGRVIWMSLEKQSDISMERGNTAKPPPSVVLKCKFSLFPPPIDSLFFVSLNRNTNNQH